MAPPFSRNTDKSCQDSEIEFDSDSKGEVQTCHDGVYPTDNDIRDTWINRRYYKHLSESERSHRIRTAESRFARAMNDPQILLVNENQDCCTTLVETLNHLGYHVDVARDGEEALDFVKQYRYRLVILPSRLSVMDGIELFDHIRQVRSSYELQAVMVGDGSDSDTNKLALTRGIQGVLQIPVNLPELMRVIHKYVGEPVWT